jgi:long-chain acyl-CoA synthetase
MSETCGIISLSHLNDAHLKVAAVGKPWKGIEVKTDTDGEILVKGKTLMTSYLEEEGNIDAFTPDGFFRTGDLGHLDSEGYFFIKGRRKNIFVLSTGKKVFPETVELKLRQTLPIADAVLVGDGRAFVSAGLFIPHDELQQMRKEKGLQKLKTSFLNKIRSGLEGFSDYEIPKNVFIIEGAPYDYPKIITPTFKIKRNVFARTFSSQIREIYGPQSGT